MVKWTHGEADHGEAYYYVTTKLLDHFVVEREYWQGENGPHKDADTQDGTWSL